MGTRIVSLVNSVPTRSKVLALADYYLYGQVRTPHLPRALLLEHGRRR